MEQYNIDQKIQEFIAKIEAKILTNRNSYRL